LKKGCWGKYLNLRGREEQIGGDRYLKYRIF
jgi:hypothetical protein